MKGEARDPAQPGLLMENMAFWNHSIAPFVPNMIFDVQHLPDGNLLGFTYACIVDVLGVSLFSFNLVARKPTLSTDDVKAWIAKQSARVGAGIFNVDGMRYVNGTECGWKSDSFVVAPMLV
mmetsp:Transcript_83487/g.131939  ORF Transcript_83487/g.131939 Transcript_83487/m.131939 type:complete len:121 (-) Transcript_83487:64-426(-)